MVKVQFLDTALFGNVFQKCNLKNASLYGSSTCENNCFVLFQQQQKKEMITIQEWYSVK